MIDFNESVLYISLRSPFARRVRLAFIEHQIEYKEEVLDVFNPPEDYLEINPLVRVPSLILKTGECLIDSSLILKGLYDQYPQSPLKPKNDRDQVISLKWSGIALGVCEGLVNYFLETKKPEAKQDEELFADYKKIFKRCLEEFEEFIKDKTSIALGGLTQADLDMGTALAYFALRYDSKWGSHFPNCAKYLSQLNSRPSFQKTQPPPP